MKKFLQDKIVIIMIILSELIIINEIYQLDDAVKLATIAVPILMYFTLKETFKMQTKIELYEKRMKFREELVDFINQKYYDNIKHEISKQEQYYQILQNFYFAIDGLLMTGVGSQESAEEVYNKIQDAHEKAMKLWDDIKIKDILDSNEFYFSQLDFSKLLLNAKLMFEDPKGVIIQYFKNINQELEKLNNSLTALYKHRNSIRNLMLNANLDFQYNILPCLKKVIYKEDLESSESTTYNNLKNLHCYLKRFVNELHNLQDNAFSIPVQDKSFAEVDKVIQEEAKLLP